MPETIAMYIATATLTAGSVMTYNAILAWTYVTLFAASAAYGQSRKKSAERKARAAFNASLKDRLEMVDITPDQPRTIALGRVRSVEGVRRKWVSGANDETLTMIVSLAGHEIDGIESFYFNDDEVTVDGSGYVTSAPYYKTRAESVRAAIVVTGGSGSTTVAQPPLTGGVVHAALLDGDGNPAAWVVVSVAGSTLSITGATIDGTYYADYQYTAGTATARIRPYLGTATQNVGADLAAEYPGKITAADKFAGIALLVVDIDYDSDVYVQGRPNVSAVFRGAKVYDPRADSTVAGGSGAQRLATPSTWAWSENPALLAYHYARHANGWAVPAAEIMPAAAVATEAAQCALSTVFTLRKSDGTTSTVTLPRHRCGLVINTAGDPGAAMDSILETMAGRAGWAGGTWQFRAARMPASVANMGEGWLAKRLQPDGTPEPGPTLVFSNGVPRADKVNRVTGVCVDPDQRYQPLPFPAIEDAALIAAEGAAYPMEVEYEGVNHIAHAQHLASIAIRRNQAALRLEAGCNLHAYRCELFDVLAMTLPRYAISGKTMEVLGWRWHPAEGVQLSLSEITDDIYTVQAELVGRDPAPNTSLPSPWDVETLTGLTVESGTALLTDGSVLTRTKVTWNAAVAQSVRAGGRVEVQFREVGGDPAQWSIWEEDGASTSAIIPGLRGGVFYVFRVRFASAPPLRVRGDWSLQAVHMIALSRPMAFNQTTAPTGFLREGDLWFDSDDSSKVYRWSGSAWVSVRDGGIQNALDNAAAAQATADGKIDTFWQATAPGTAAEGDIWFDTDDGNRQYRRTSGVWVVAADTRIGDAISAASDAQATADGKVVTFVSTAAPTAEAVGDLWIDTDDGNKLYRWSGSAWVALPLGTGAIDANAVTQILVDTVAAVAITGLTGIPFGATSSIATVSFTAPTTGDVLVTCSGNCKLITAASGVAPSPFENVRTSFYVNTNGAGAARDTASSIYQLDREVGYSTTVNFPVFYTKRVSIVAGNTYEFNLRGQKLYTQSNVEITNLEMRAEIIKR